MPQTLKPFDDPYFIKGRGAGDNCCLSQATVQLSAVEFSDLASGEDLLIATRKAGIAGDSPSRGRVIASEHDDPHTSLMTATHGHGNLWPEWIADAHETERDQFLRII